MHGLTGAPDVLQLESILSDFTKTLTAYDDPIIVHEESELGKFLSHMTLSLQLCGFSAMVSILNGVNHAADALLVFTKHGLAKALTFLSTSSELDTCGSLADQFSEVFRFHNYNLCLVFRLVLSLAILTDQNC